MSQDSLSLVETLKESGYERCKICSFGTPSTSGGFYAWQKPLDDGVNMYLVPMDCGKTYTGGTFGGNRAIPTEWAAGLWVDDREGDSDLSAAVDSCGFGFLPSSQAQKFQSLPCFGTFTEALSFAAWAEGRYREGDIAPDMVNYENIGYLEEAADLYPTVGEVRRFWQTELGDPERPDNIARHREIARWESGAYVTSEDLGWLSPIRGDVGLSCQVVCEGSIRNLIRGDGDFGVRARMALEFTGLMDMTWHLGSGYDRITSFDNVVDYLAFQKRMEANEEFAQAYLIDCAPLYHELPEAARELIEEEPPEYVEHDLAPVADMARTPEEEKVV